MRKHIFTGALGNIWAFLISGIFFVYFGNTVGLTPFQWGLMGGISSWLVVAQLLSAVLTERTRKRKVLWFWFAFVERSFRIGGILIAFLFWRMGWPHGGLLLIAFICAANFCGNLASPPWMSWLADIIPDKEHGRFWGRRSAWIALSVISVLVPSGFLLDRVPPERKIFITVVIFSLGTVIGFIDVLIHRTIPEPRMLKSGPNRLYKTIVEPLKDPDFRPWLLFNIFWTFSLLLGGGLSSIYVVEELGIKNNFLGGAIVLTCFSMLGSIFSGRISGIFVDRLGSKKVLRVGHLFWGFFPLFWFFATPQNALIWLGIGSLVGGVSSTAAVTAANKLITRLPPTEKIAMYAAASSTLGSLAGGVGIMTAGSIVRLLEGWHAPFLSFTMNPYRIVFLASVILRLFSVFVFLPRIKDPVRPA